jgi:hypothetical protein
MAKKDVIRPFPCSFFPNRNRLRWVAIWFWMQHLSCCECARRSKRHIACSDFFIKVSALCIAGKFSAMLFYFLLDFIKFAHYT